MKNLPAILPILVIGLILPFQLLAFAGTDQPRIFCSEPAFDFGTLDQSNTIEHVFVIQNQGKAPLQLPHVRACCGATAILTTNLLAPGESANLMTRMSLQGRKGPMRKTFYVRSNDLGQPYYPLYLTGTVLDSTGEAGMVVSSAISTFQVHPDAIDFGQIRNDTVAVRSVVLASKESPFQMDRLACSVPWLVAEEEAGSNRQSRHEVQVKTRPPLPTGIVTGQVSLMVGPMMATTITVSVVARVFADLEAMPEAIHLVGGGETSRVQERYVSVFSRAGTAFNILKVEVPDENIGVEVLPVKAGHCRIKLTRVLPDSELDGKLLRMETDYAGDPIIEIPFVVARKRGAE